MAESEKKGYISQKKEPGRPWPLQNSEGGGSIQGQIGLQKGAP